jgi:hypothetical protein
MSHKGKCEYPEMCIKLIAAAYPFLERIPPIQWIVGPGYIYDLSKRKLPLSIVIRAVFINKLPTVACLLAPNAYKCN